MKTGTPFEYSGLWILSSWVSNIENTRCTNMWLCSVLYTKHLPSITFLNHWVMNAMNDVREIAWNNRRKLHHLLINIYFFADLIFIGEQSWLNMFTSLAYKTHCGPFKSVDIIDNQLNMPSAVLFHFKTQQKKTGKNNIFFSIVIKHHCHWEL